MSEELKKFMGEFCDIIMPGHDKAKGYINVTHKVKSLGVDRRTYYHWKNCESYPRLPDLVQRLNDKGYTLQIMPMEIYKDGK